MDISVIIVSYNVQYFLEQCILSVQAASENIVTEIIVVDNNSSDNTCKLLLEKYPEIILIQNQQNVGFSKANNQGVNIAKGEYVLILNPDTVIAEDTLENIKKFAETKEKFGALGVKLIDGSGNFLPESKRGIPTAKVSFNKLFGVTNKQKGKYYAAHLSENETGKVDILVGAFMFLKKEVYEEVYGFDEDYFMYGEDIDLSYKILKKGYQNYYYANTQVIHYKGESTEKDIKYLKYFNNSMHIFYNKHFKRNLVYDFFMRFGMYCWYLTKYFSYKFYKKTIKPILNVLYLGSNKKVVNYFEKKYLVVNEKLIDQYVQIKLLIDNKNIDTIVFDNSITTNKKIIRHFQELKYKNCTFKIHPKNTNYLIGSTNSINRGTVEIIK